MHIVHRVNLAMIAVLLPAGVLAAATVVPHRAGAGAGRVGATGLGVEVVVDGQPAGQTPSPTVVSTTVAPRPAVVMPALPVTTLPRSTSTTLRPLATTTSTVAATGQTTVPPAAPPSSWSKTANGVSVSMHIEPAQPVAGQPVKFVVDEVSAPGPCCVVLLNFGDQDGGPLNGGTGGGNTCESTTSYRGLAVTHTYAKPGAYQIYLDAFIHPCGDGPGGVVSDVGRIGLPACITVGPSTAGSPRC